MTRRAGLRRGAFLATAGVVTAAFIVGASSLASSADTTSSTDGLSYVALGDSYSAGYGLPIASDSIDGCAQAAQSFPRQMAASLGLTLSDASCTGATIANVLDTPQSVTASGGPATVPIQIDALASNTDVVTIMISGNDLGFTSILKNCIALSKDGPLALHNSDANCASLPDAGQFDLLATTIIKAHLNALFSVVKTKTPQAKVFVVGYPALMPATDHIPSGGCFSPPTSLNSFPFTNTDIPYLAGIESTLNGVIKDEAEGAGATFIPLQAATVANTACAATEAYINGITVTSFNPPDLAPGAFHPNLAGATFLAQQVGAVITADFPPTEPAEPTNTPTATATATVAPISDAPVVDKTITVSTTSRPGTQLAETGSDILLWMIGGGLLLLAGIGALAIISDVRKHTTQ